MAQMTPATLDPGQGGQCQPVIQSPPGPRGNRRQEAHSSPVSPVPAAQPVDRAMVPEHAHKVCAFLGPPGPLVSAESELSMGPG